jgi:integrase
VARIAKRVATVAGLDARRYAGHSLRAGLATAAAAAGVEERVIAEQTGHKCMAVLETPPELWIHILALEVTRAVRWETSPDEG